MSTADDTKRLRIREAALVDDLKRTDCETSVGAPSVLAQTTTLSTYPTVAQCFFVCTPLTVLGQEQEGAGAAVTAGGSTFYALNLGATVPPLGTQVLTTFVGNRWVFRYDA